MPLASYKTALFYVPGTLGRCLGVPQAMQLFLAYAKQKTMSKKGDFLKNPLPLNGLNLAQISKKKMLLRWTQILYIFKLFFQHRVFLNADNGRVMKRVSEIFKQYILKLTL